MKVLITGGAGFLGRHLSARLAASGHHVIVYDLAIEEATGATPFPARAETGADRIRWVDGDIGDACSLDAVLREDEVSVVIHLATLLTPACAADPVRAAVVNGVGTATVFATAARVPSVRRILFASSVAAFDAAPGRAIGDDRCLCPPSVYGATKAFGEHLARAMQTMHPNIIFLGLRFGWVYGPGRIRGWNEVHQCIEEFALERPLARYPDYQAAHDWTYVDDAIDAVVCCLDSPKPTVTTYNVSGDYRPMADAVAHLKRRFPTVRAEPYRATLPPVGWNFVSDRITTEAGFRARITLEEGLDRIVNAIRKAHGLPTLPQ